MIAVSNNKLSIPENERNIGCEGDSNVATRIFVVSNLLLSALTFRLDLSKADGTTDTCLLTKTVTDTTIDLLWNILASNMSTHGALKVQLRAFDSNELDPDNEREIWHSEMGQFVIKDSINAASSIPSPLPSEFTEMEQRIEEDMQSIAGDMQTINTAMQNISEDMQTIASAEDAIALDKQAVATDRQTVANDLLATGQDRTTVANDKLIVAQYKQAAATSESEAKAARDAAIAARDFAESIYLWQSAPLLSNADNAVLLDAPHLPV